MYGIGVFFAIRHAMQAFRPDSDLPFESPLTPERVLLGLYSDIKKDFRPDFSRETEDMVPLSAETQESVRGMS